MIEMQVERIGGALGAEIRGLDLASTDMSMTQTSAERGGSGVVLGSDFGQAVISRISDRYIEKPSFG